MEQNYEDYQRIIYKLAHKWNRSDVDFDDLIGEGNLAFAEAQRKFEPDRGVKFSTYLYQAVNNKMNTFVTSSSAIVQKEDPINEEDFRGNRISPERYSILKQWAGTLSKESQFILKIVLIETPVEIIEWTKKEVYFPRMNIKYITRYLRGLGWKWDTIRNCLREIRTAVKEI